MIRDRRRRDLEKRIDEIETAAGRPMIGGDAIDIMEIEIIHTDMDGEQIGDEPWIHTWFEPGEGWQSTGTMLDDDATDADDETGEDADE